MDEAALNYKPGSQPDDGSCFYGYTILDCDYGSSLISVPEDATELCLSDDEVSAAISMDSPLTFTAHHIPTPISAPTVI